MKKNLNKLEQNLGFKINNLDLYINAITHKSADKINNYEKLEFLGDRVLGLCISKKLLEIFPNEKEGILDKKLASLVNKNKCFEIGNFLELDKIIKIGNLRLKKQIIEKKIISDSCEALIGAIYLDKGFDFVEKFILKIWNKHINDKNITIIDAKTKLQEHSLKKFKILPIYKFISDTGPKHKPNFKVAVKLKDTSFIEAEGSSKKIAQQAAAAKLLKLLDSKNEI
tara:strand:+ start:2341 stop:3018 length:678 start_codon:yes stop_codon:yes gene_type:complete